MISLFSHMTGFVINIHGNFFVLFCFSFSAQADMPYHSALDKQRTLCVFIMWALASEHAYLVRNYLEDLIYHRTDLHTVDESLNIDGEVQTVNNYNGPKARVHVHSTGIKRMVQISGVDLHYVGKTN